MMSFIINYYHNACSVRDTIVFPLFTVSVWAGEKDSNTLLVDAFFSEKKGKKSPFSKISGYVWTGPKSGKFVYY